MSDWYSTDNNDIGSLCRSFDDDHEVKVGDTFEIEGERRARRVTYIMGHHVCTRDQGAFPVGPIRYRWTTASATGITANSTRSIGIQRDVSNRTSPYIPPTANTPTSPTVPASHISHALIVGISDYSDATYRDGVRFAADDATKIASEIAAFSPDIQITSLTNDRANHDGLRERILSLFHNNEQLGCNLLVYFAGHANYGSSDRNTLFLLPSDVRASIMIDNISAISCSDIKDHMIDHAIKGYGSCYLVLDCCYAATVGGRSGKSVQEIAPALGLPDLGISNIEGQSVYILAASMQDQVSHEMIDSGHGLFSSGILAALRAAANSESQFIDVHALFRQAKSHALSSRTPNMSQTPVIHEINGTGATIVPFLRRTPNV